MSKIAAEKLVLSVYLPYIRKGIVTQHSGLILPVESSTDTTTTKGLNLSDVY